MHVIETGGLDYYEPLTRFIPTGTIPKPVLDALSGIVAPEAFHHLVTTLADEDLTNLPQCLSGAPHESWGVIWRAVRDFGHSVMLNAIVTYAPSTSDKLAEELVTRWQGGLGSQVMGLLTSPQNDRYDELAQVYSHALLNCPVLADEIARFSDANQEEIPDYSSFLVAGMLQPIIALGNGLELVQNNWALRKFGAVVDRLKDNTPPDYINKLGLNGLETKEITTIGHVIHQAVQIVTERAERRTLPTTPTPEPLTSPIKLPAIRQKVIDVSREKRVTIVAGQPIISASITPEGFLVLTRDGLFSRPHGRKQSASLSAGPAIDRYNGYSCGVIDSPGALSPSGRFYIARNSDNLHWMNPEALLDAEKNEAQLICVRIGPDLLPTGQQSFEPLEKGFGPFRSEIIKENFSWGADSNSEYVLFAARHIPRLYKYTYSPSGERSIHRFDAIRQEPYAGFAGCKASIAGQSISVDSRYVAALLVTEQNTKTIKLFDQARYTKDQHRDDAIMELQHQMLWDDSSIQQALHGLQFLPNNDLLLLNSENYAVGLMKAKNGRLGSITWGEPQDFTFNARFQPGLFDTNLSDKTLAVVDKACKSVILYDPSWNQVRRILPTLKTEEKISYIRIMSDSRLLLVGDSAGGVWEIEMPVL